MSVSNLVIDAGRVAVLLAVALAAMPLLGAASAATRRFVLALALAGALVLPAASAVVPAWRVGGSIAVSPSLRAMIVGEGAAPDSAASSLAPAAAVDSPTAIAASGPSRHVAPVDVIALVWALGALFVVARLAAGLTQAKRMVRRSVADPSWDPAVARAEAATGVRARVRVTGALDGPAVTGIFAPVVLVPRGSPSWSEERRYAVLLHEIAHVRQHDCLAQILAQLACALNWFDPIVWLAARRLRVERELAADDAVVAAGARPSSYAVDLLAIAGAGSLRPSPIGALGMAEGSELAARIAAIVATGRSRDPLPRAKALLVAGGLVALVLLVACAKPAPGAAAPPARVAAASVAAATPDSSIDPRLQAIADDEVERTSREWDAAAATILILNASTGEIVANAGRVHGAPADVALGHAYFTGSTMKAVTLAAALDEGVVSTSEQIDCGQGKMTYAGKTMSDAHQNGTLAVPEVFAVSSNVGFTKIFDRLGGARLERWLHAFHFGEAPNVEGAIAGEMPRAIVDKSFEGAVAAIGEGVAASPLQVAAAYAAIENGGEYVPPTLTRRHGEASRTRIMKPETARTMVDMLDRVVSSEAGTGKSARIPGKRVVGKTGTAGWELPGGKEGTYSSFVGFVAGDPSHLVILVGVEQPRDGEGGPTVAAPAFARVATRALGGG